MALHVQCSDRIVVDSCGDGWTSELAVRWDRRAQCFLVTAQSLRAVGEQPIDAIGNGDRQDEGAHLSALIERFDSAVCRLEVPTDADVASDHGGTAKLVLEPLTRLTKQRDDVLERVLDSTTPLSWLRPLLLQWKMRLESLAAVAAAGSGRFSTWLVHELLVLAAGFQIAGNSLDARLASGLALRVARSLLVKRGFPSLQGIAELESAAERDLLGYVAFDTVLTKSLELLSRLDPPPQVQAQLASEFAALRLRAPLSVPILSAVVSLLQRQHRDALVGRLLSGSTLTSLDASLTLLYARALERDGFWSLSISVAKRFIDSLSRDHGASQQAGCDLLHAHITRLASLQQLRDQAEHLARAGESKQAVASFSMCLQLVRSGPRHDGKVTSSLLMKRAVALLALGKTRQALRDLEDSVRLNPNDQVAQLVLSTTLLEQETGRIKARLTA